MAAIIGRLRHSVNGAVRKIESLLVLDSLHDIFVGNENVRAEARAFVQALSLVAEAIDGAVLVLAHPSLNGLDRGSGTSGSTAWHNAVRSCLFPTRPAPVDGFSLDPDLRVLKTVKSNYARVGEAIGCAGGMVSSSCAATPPAALPAAAAMTSRG